MIYLIGWGRDDTQPISQPQVTVDNADDLDKVLDRIEQAGIPQLVDISPADDGHDVPHGLQVGVGPIDRSFAVYFGTPAGGVGYDPHLPTSTATIKFDSGGEPTNYGPDLLRLTPDQARQVAREYVTSGRRPTCVQWDALSTPAPTVNSAADTHERQRRAEALRNLVELRISVEAATIALAQFAWDSDTDLVTFTRIDALHLLRRFKDQHLTAGECRRWAEALEGRDDLGYEAEYEDTLKDFLFDIGTPDLVGGLTAALTARWENTFVTGTRPERTTEPKPSQ